MHRHLTGNGQPKDRFRRINTVPPGQCDPSLRTYRPPALDHPGGNLRRQLVYRPAQYRDCHQWLSAHGIDITDGVCSRNPAKIIGIVHHGHKEIRGTDNPQAIADIQDGSIIPAGIADQKSRVVIIGGRGVKNAVQDIRSNFTAATGSVTEFGKSC